jgi:hypothetical protein
MATTTILETYDTQMFDSGDIDVPMHGSTEPWLQGEAFMDDDEDLLTKSQNADHESVEVDMEPYENGEYAEYEMGDESDTGSYHGETELVDVEVVDASIAHTPAVIPTDLDATQLSNGITNVSESGFVETLAPTVTLALPDSHSESHTSLSQKDASDGTIGRSSLIPATEPPLLISPLLDLHPLPSEGPSGEMHHHTNEILTSHLAPSSDSADAVEGTSHFTEPIGYHSTPLNDGDVNYGVAGVDSAYLDDNNIHRETAIPTYTDDGSDNRPPEHADPTTETDPHEIAEGVYIDPPPAVLLTLPSSELPELCLFNQPHSNSGSTTPSTEGVRREKHTFTLLLQNKPTLYYEPLTKVFEALRQEEYVAQFPEVADGELVLDAYDLQLAISEVPFFPSSV